VLTEDAFETQDIKRYQNAGYFQERCDVCCYDWLTLYIIHTVIHQFSVQNSEQMILMSWFFY